MSDNKSSRALYEKHKKPYQAYQKKIAQLSKEQQKKLDEKLKLQLDQDMERAEYDQKINEAYEEIREAKERFRKIVGLDDIPRDLDDLPAEDKAGRELLEKHQKPYQAYLRETGKMYARQQGLIDEKFQVTSAAAQKLAKHESSLEALTAEIARVRNEFLTSTGLTEIPIEWQDYGAPERE